MLLQLLEVFVVALVVEFYGDGTGLELFAQLASLLLLLLLSHFAGFALHDGFACLFGEVELGAHSEVPDELVPPALAAVLSGPSQTLCFGQFTQPQLVFRIAAGAGGPLL